eukprot:1177724-Prorocentrum_minimum.AAC.4
MQRLYARFVHTCVPKTSSTAPPSQPIVGEVKRVTSSAMSPVETYGQLQAAPDYNDFDMDLDDEIEVKTSGKLRCVQMQALSTFLRILNVHVKHRRKNPTSGGCRELELDY